MTTLALYWPEYRLFPYERAFALSEASALLSPSDGFDDRGAHVTLQTTRAPAARRLTYFRAFQRTPSPPEPTIQHLVETASAGMRRQSTRYSVHGLHEYKGKFNPQVARCLLNASGLPKNALVLDPFCGSGTTLVECAHAGLRAVGVDINPLATLIASAKVQALACDPDELRTEVAAVIRGARQRRARETRADERAAYLSRWFEQRPLQQFEALRLEIEDRPGSLRDVLLVIVSNILREFSLQEPADLRIRRRKSPPSDRDPFETVQSEVETLAERLQVVRDLMDFPAPSVRTIQTDVRTLEAREEGRKLRGSFHAAITSPPYAMALPYVDTQRLSLVWLGLVRPAALPALQADLIGSREFNRLPRRTWDVHLLGNEHSLPPRQARMCRELLSLVGRNDGFRRQAVPALLYRYLVGMRDSMRAVRSLLRERAPFFLIVGHNHTVLGGKRIDLSTPELLAELGQAVGFEVEGRQPLETYQRYGLHQKNAIDREELLTLRAI